MLLRIVLHHKADLNLLAAAKDRLDPSIDEQAIHVVNLRVIELTEQLGDGLLDFDHHMEG